MISWNWGRKLKERKSYFSSQGICQCVCLHMYTQSCTCTWWVLENLLFCSKHYIICNILCITCPLCVRQCAEGGQGNTFLAPMYLKCSRFMFSILAFCIKLSVPNNSTLYLDVYIHLNRSYINGFSSGSCSVMSNTLWPHGLQHARPPCPSPTPWIYLNSCPWSWWCHPSISSALLSPSPPAFNLS